MFGWIVFCVGTPDDEYHFKRDVFLELEEFEDKQQGKDNILETFIYIITTRKQQAKVIVDVTYTYDVDVQVVIDITAHNNENNVRGNN